MPQGRWPAALVYSAHSVLTLAWCPAAQLATSQESARVAVAAGESATCSARARADAQAAIAAALNAELKSERAKSADARCCSALAKAQSSAESLS